MPSDHSVDAAPASRRLPPVSLESIAARLEDLEQRRDSGDHEIATQVEALRNELRALSARVVGIESKTESIDDKVTAIAADLKKQTEVIGESPDLGTGKDGSGMRKQLANLVDKQRVPPFIQWLTPFAVTAMGAYELLHRLGILK